MNNYDHLLVALDESSISYAAAEHALELAKVFHSHVTLLSVIAVDPFKGVDFYKVAPAVTDYFMHAEQNALDRLNDLKQSFVREGIQVTTKILHGMAPSCWAVWRKMCWHFLIFQYWWSDNNRY